MGVHKGIAFGFAVAMLASCAHIGGSSPDAGDWPRYARDLSGVRYSPLKDINRKNVSTLAQAWSFRVRPQGGGALVSSATPIVIDGVLYLPVVDAVVALDVGAISTPVQTQFGWHVITLNDKRDQAIPPLEEVRAELSAEVERSVAEGAVADLMEAAEVTLTEGLDPAVLSDDSLFTFD